MATTGDDILDGALAEFAEEHEQHVDVRTAASRAAQAAASVSASARRDAALAAAGAGAGADDDVMAAALQQLIAEMQSPDFRGVLDDAMRELQGGPGRGPPGATNDAAAAARIFSALSEGGAGGAPGTADGAGSDAAILKTLELLQGFAAEGSSGADGTADGSAPATAAGATAAMAEDVMERMAAEFERMGAAEDFDPAVTGMMKQLLSRDLMYLPMKQISEAFPKWLVENADKLSSSDYERYGHQYQCFQKLVSLYESDPDNFVRLLELMQELQELGQPPAEIISELAPGLQLSPDGSLPSLQLPAGLAGPGGGGGGAAGPGDGCAVM